MLKKLQMFSLATVLALAPTMTIGAAYTETVNGITWTYKLSNNKAELGNGSSAAIDTSTKGAVVIPSTFSAGMYPVTGLGNYAFGGCTKLTSVTIPSSVLYIGARAFIVCTGLTSVTIPTNVVTLGNYAFCDCAGLRSVTVPSNVKFFGNNVFRNCTGLTSVTIQDGVSSIGDYAFSGCTGLTSVTFPSSGVTSIGDYAFS